MTQFQTANRTPSTATGGTGSRGVTGKQGPPVKAGPNVALIIVAIALGLLTVIITNWYIHQIRTQVEAEEMTFWKLKAPVEEGDTLDVDRDLRAVTIPAPEELRSHYIDNLGALTREELANYDGTAFRRPANSGAILTADLFTPYGRAADELPVRSGHLGITIEIDRDSAPPFLRPEMEINLYGTFVIPGQGEKVTLIMEEIRVLAVGDQTSPTAPSGNRRGYNTITIELEPDEVRAIRTLNQKLVEGTEFTIALRKGTETTREIEVGGINPELIKAFNLDIDRDN